jgi:hypothetical protein
MLRGEPGSCYGESTYVMARQGSAEVSARLVDRGAIEVDLVCIMTRGPKKVDPRAAGRAGLFKKVTFEGP